MGTTDWHSPLSPPSFTEPKATEEHLHGNTKQVDHMAFPPDFFECNTSHSTTDDDSSREMLTGTSSMKNESDCESIQTNESKTRMNRSSSSVPSFCISESMHCATALIDDIRPNDIDKLLLQELQELSSADRSKVQEEIHGVFNCAIAEDDEKIGEALMKLEEEIRMIHREVLLDSYGLSSSGHTYEESIWAFLSLDEESSTQSLNNEKLLYSYIFHKSFRLRFLRADLFDARKAAHRYLRCLECLLKYYGRYAF